MFELNYEGIEFPVLNNDFRKIEMKSNICINGFSYENKLSFPIYILDTKFENSWKQKDENKLHYMYIENFDRFLFHKIKNKKKTFAKVVYSV